ncbi:MAG: M28 family peptidase [Gemmatimonadaceae bacterium]
MIRLPLRASRRALVTALAGPFLVATACTGQNRPGSAPRAAPGTGRDISPADLRMRLFALAHDSMMGRMTGEAGNAKAAEYVAAEFRRLGLEPAGEGGTYFQTVPFYRIGVDERASRLTANGTALEMGRDFLPLSPRIAWRLSGSGEIPVVFGGVATDSSTWIPADQAAGKIVVLGLPGSPSRDLANRGLVMRLVRHPRFARAAAVAIPQLDRYGPEVVARIRGGETTLDTARLDIPAPLAISPRAASVLLGADPASLQPGAMGATVRGSIASTMGPLPFPARNVVAVFRGADPALRAQYLSLTGHNDHVGFDHAPVDHDSLRAYNRVVRPMGADSPLREPTAEEAPRIRALLDSLRRLHPPRLDSIRNGADDDGSGTVALLEIAERLAGGPRPRRSILFVSHTAEEIGLVGSRWFTDHATVPVDSIVGEIDMDMIGRGGRDDLPDAGPQYLEVIGAKRNSVEFGEILEAVNARQPLPFAFNYEYDRPGHPLQYYCRADHYSYARYNIPAVAFSRGEHLDYHQVTDEPQYIDYDALARVARFVHDAALELANLDHRPKTDRPKGDPRAPCRQ